MTRLIRLSRSLVPLAVVLGVVASGTATAATTAALILGRSNSTAGTTRLATTGNGPALALSVHRAGVPPFTVGTDSTVVPHLNASYVGGLAAGQLQRPLTGSCAAGQALRAVTRIGAVTCGPSYVASFVVDTTAAGTAGNVADIDDPVLNGHPDAVLLMTPLATPAGGDAHPTALWWDAAHEQWAVVNVDQAPVPVGSRFEIVVVAS